MQSSISFKNLLESRSPRPDVFAILPTGSWRPSFFLLFPRIISVIKGKVGESVFHSHHRCASRSHNETKLKRFGITATTAIGWGQEEGMDEDTAMWKEGVRVIIYGSPERQKKMLFERLFSRNKKINALTEVKENQYLTASGIKFFQKQTAGNNCPVCMTDRLNVRLRSTEIIFAWLKEGKPPIPFFES